MLYSLTSLKYFKLNLKLDMDLILILILIILDVKTSIKQTKLFWFGYFDKTNIYDSLIFLNLINVYCIICATELTLHFWDCTKDAKSGPFVLLLALISIVFAIYAVQLPDKPIIICCITYKKKLVLRHHVLYSPLIIII